MLRLSLILFQNIYHQINGILGNQKYFIVGRSELRHPVQPEQRHSVQPEQRHSVQPEQRHPVQPEQRHPVQPEQRHPGKLAGGKFIRDLNNAVAPK